MIRVLLWIFVAINIGLGIACLIDPIAMLAPIGVEAVDNRGVVELRAMYGGLEFGFGLFLAWCAMEKTRARVGLTAATLQIGGLGFARLAAYVVLMPDGWLTPFLCVAEVAGAVVGAATLWWTRAEVGEH